MALVVAILYWSEGPVQQCVFVTDAYPHWLKKTPILILHLLAHPRLSSSWVNQLTRIDIADISYGIEQYKHYNNIKL